MIDERPVEESCRPDIVVCCDFDGTISVEDLGVATMERFAPPEWWDIEQAWRRGEISSKECLARQFALLNTSLEELDAFWRTQPIDPSFEPFVRKMREIGVPLVILSDGGDYYIDACLKAHGLDDLELRSNRMQYVNGGFQFSFPYENPSCGMCGNCKRMHVEKLKDEYGAVVFIGDGHSDKCVVRHVDRVWAKGFLADYCEVQNIPCVRFSSFAELISLIDDLGGLRSQNTRKSVSALAI